TKANGGGSELLPLQQHLEDRSIVLSGEHRCAGREFLQRLLLAADLHRRHDRLGCDDIRDRHGTIRGPGLRGLKGFATDLCGGGGRLGADRSAKGGGPYGYAVTSSRPSQALTAGGSTHPTLPSGRR